MRNYLLVVLALIALCTETTIAFAQWVEGISFVGYTNGEWKLYSASNDSKISPILETRYELRGPVVNLSTSDIAYIAIDGSVNEQRRDSQKPTVLLKASKKRAYTQSAYTPDGEKLYIVELKEGASVDTDILVLDKSSNKIKPVVTQRSAQFEPYAPTNNDLYYSNVICTIGCGKIIQEIWHMNVVSGEAEQVTLLNSISKQPYILPKDEWLYFTSNKSGNYHIWRYSINKKKYEELTDGNVTDTNPVLDNKKNLYFIRRSPQAAQLMRRSPKGELTVMKLPEGVTDLRDLRMSH